MRVFLSDGTLIMDSCWETYRLVRWQWGSDGTLVWREDGAEIRAAILEQAPESLVLRMDLRDGSHEEHFRVAATPFTCPDMPR